MHHPYGYWQYVSALHSWLGLYDVSSVTAPQGRLITGIFCFIRILLSSARMTPVRIFTDSVTFKVRLLFSLFLCPKSLCAFGIYFKKGGNQNEKTKLSAHAKANVKTCCIQAADDEKGGSKTCKVPVNYGICPSRKAETSPEKRCVICRKIRVHTNRWYWWTRQICRRTNGWNGAAEESAEAMQPQF